MSLIQQLKALLSANGWEANEVGDPPSLAMRFKGVHGEWSCVMQAIESQNQVAFFSILPGDVATDKYYRIAEFITRANYGLVFGNFEMSFDTGDVRFRTSAAVFDGIISSELLNTLVNTNIAMMDAFLPGFQEVQNGDLSPDQVMLKIKSGG